MLSPRAESSEEMMDFFCCRRTGRPPIRPTEASELADRAGGHEAPNSSSIGCFELCFVPSAGMTLLNLASAEQLRWAYGSSRLICCRRNLAKNGPDATCTTGAAASPTELRVAAVTATELLASLAARRCRH